MINSHKSILIRQLKLLLLFELIEFDVIYFIVFYLFDVVD